jgi:hypothetical protein
MIMLTNQDTGKSIILNKDKIVRIEDLGSYRILVFQVTSSQADKVYVIETISDIWRIYNE